MVHVRWSAMAALLFGALVADVVYASEVRDGAHDFDFEIGKWHTHVRRLLHPLTGSDVWADYDGTSVIRPVWAGRANLVELEVSGPKGRIEGASLRLYNPTARQWSLNFVNSAVGEISTPTVGSFQHGTGEFYDQEMLDGRAILVRFIVEPRGRNNCHFEQAYSADGGKTWELNWVADDRRT